MLCTHASLSAQLDCAIASLEQVKCVVSFLTFFHHAVTCFSLVCFRSSIAACWYRGLKNQNSHRKNGLTRLRSWKRDKEKITACINMRVQQRKRSQCAATWEYSRYVMASEPKRQTTMAIDVQSRRICVHTLEWTERSASFITLLSQPRLKLTSLLLEQTATWWNGVWKKE